MKAAKGIDINFNITKMIKVTDLISFDGPLLSHYINEKGENYLFYWVDVDESYNRWLFFRIDLLSIQDYLTRKTTLYELIKNQPDGFIYSVDINDKTEYHNLKLILLSEIEQTYLPAIDSFYDFEPQDSIDLASLSQKFNSGILEFRITGDSVKYGSISLAKLAPIIPKIEDVRKSLATKYIKGRKKNFIDDSKTQKKKENTKILQLDTQYDFIYSLAGSFRIILRPLSQQMSLLGAKTFADEFAEEMINLFSSGFNKETINNFANRYDKNLIKKYNDFIYYLHGSKLGLDIKWYNNNSNCHFTNKINPKCTSDILKNLSDFNFNESEDLSYRGRFFAINIHTGKYSFESIEGDDFISSGFFDDSRKKVAFMISFNKTYDVVIKRKTTEKVGEKERIKDVLTSFIEIAE